MAPLPAVVFFLLSLLILSVNVTAKAETSNSNVIKLNSSLAANTSTSSWLSPSGRFAFGFYREGSAFAVGIWLVDDPYQKENITVVWTARRDDSLASSSSTLWLARNGLILRSEEGGEEIPLTNMVQSRAKSAAMLDSGNFVLYGNDSGVIWESFTSPTDTILGGQNLTDDNDLVSSVSASNHSSGRFWLRMQTDGNLVSYPVSSTKFTENAYWASNTRQAYQLSLSVSGFLVFLPESVGALVNGSHNGQVNGTVIYRATLDVDGVFRLYLHNYSVMSSSSSSSSSRVSMVWSNLNDQCEVKGFCGLNSYCAINGTKAGCYCYPGFVMINATYTSLGCYLNSSEDGCTDYNVTGYRISPIETIEWGDHPYSVVSLEKEQVCSNSCLKDCNCKAVLFYGADGICKKYRLPLRFGRISRNISSKAFIKEAQGSFGVAGDMDPNPNSTVIKYETKNSHGLIAILAVSLGSIAVICIAFAVSSFTVYRHRLQRYKKLLEYTKMGLADEFTLQSFSYNELEESTHGFKEELGQGTFGAVYKGTLSSSNKMVAVKRLEKVVEEGVREFKAEITTIGRTHHRNLVQLLGYCVERSRKLLVYEYMSNGSLADLLFKSAACRASWRERVGIVLDVAKGVLYLHEECGVHIIHCNLKPQNILLDHNWTAKISDFGLARLLVLPNDQNPTETGINERRGYLAPEWQKNALISVKSDIYSFGIVLLETVCCRKSIELNVSAPDEIILSSWVYKCFTAGELLKLVEDDGQNVDLKTLERMVKVGLWCVQEDPALRPLMKNVILMLEGTMDIPVPSSPELPRPGHAL